MKSRNRSPDHAGAAAARVRDAGASPGPWVSDPASLLATPGVNPGSLIQRYQRDTDETMADLSVPIYIDGKHRGAVRIGFRRLETR